MCDRAEASHGPAIALPTGLSNAREGTKRRRVSARRAVEGAVMPPPPALPREEFETLLDELLVELEDAAVAGVGIDHQLTVRQASSEVDRVLRRDHPVALAVRDEHGLANDGEVGR